MKNAHKLLLLIAFGALTASCTPQALNEHNSEENVEIQANGGDDSSNTDDDREEN